MSREMPANFVFPLFSGEEGRGREQKRREGRGKRKGSLGSDRVWKPLAISDWVPVQLTNVHTIILTRSVSEGSVGKRPRWRFGLVWIWIVGDPGENLALT